MRNQSGPLPSRAWAALALVASFGFGACSMVADPVPPSPRPPAPRPERETPVVRQPERPVESPARDRVFVPLPTEVRALWVVRTTLTHPDSITAMVERASRAGFNMLLVQVRGRGDAYYQSRWEPKPESVTRQGRAFDPLAQVIREAHQRGLAVHAWVNGHLVGGVGALPADPLHLINSRPELLAVPRELAREMYDVNPQNPRFAAALLSYAQENVDRIEGIYTAPSHPAVKEHLYSVWMDLVESYDLDGLHFDYIRYPNPEFDYSRVALDRFREWVSPRLAEDGRASLEEARRSDPLAYVDSLPEDWDDFRRAQITELVERIYHGVKKRRPELVVSAAVFANGEDAYRSRFQDWRGWLADGILDAVAPMAYTPVDSLFEEQVRGAVEVVGGNRVWAGIGIYQTTYRGTIDKIEISRRLGTRGIVLFSYDWAVSEGESDGTRSFLDRVGAEAFRRRRE